MTDDVAYIREEALKQRIAQLQEELAKAQKLLVQGEILREDYKLKFALLTSDRDRLVVDLALEREKLLQWEADREVLYDDKEALRAENKRLREVLSSLHRSPSGSSGYVYLRGAVRQDQIDAALPPTPPKEEPNEQTTNRSRNVTDPRGA